MRRCSTVDMSPNMSRKLSTVSASDWWRFSAEWLDTSNSHTMVFADSFPARASLPFIRIVFTQYNHYKFDLFWFSCHLFWSVSDNVRSILALWFLNTSCTRLEYCRFYVCPNRTCKRWTSLVHVDLDQRTICPIEFYKGSSVLNPMHHFHFFYDSLQVKQIFFFDDNLRPVISSNLKG